MVGRSSQAIEKQGNSVERRHFFFFAGGPSGAVEVGHLDALWVPHWEIRLVIVVARVVISCRWGARVCLSTRSYRPEGGLWVGVVSPCDRARKVVTKSEAIDSLLYTTTLSSTTHIFPPRTPLSNEDGQLVR